MVQITDINILNDLHCNKNVCMFICYYLNEFKKNRNSELSQIKKNIEQGRSAVSISGFYFALNLATINVVMKLPNSNALQEAAETFAKLVQTTIEVS